MQAIMVSIQPQWVEKILNGEKTIEIRTTMPKCKLPCKVYIYQTKKNFIYKILKRLGLCKGKVVAEFTLKKIDEYEFELWDDNTYESIGKVYYDIETGEREVDVFESDEDIEKTEFVKDSNLTRPQLRQYLGTGIRTCFAWHIDDLVVYDKPKELSEFRTTGDCFNSKNIKIKESLYGEYVGNYNENSFCRICKYYDSDWGDCTKRIHTLTRPPQSWCYVESICQNT